MIRVLLLYVAGLWLFQFLPRVPPIAALAVVTPALLVLYPLKSLRPVLAVLAGLGWGWIYAQWHAPPALPPAVLASPQWVEGQVVSLVDASPTRSRFVLQLSRAGEAPPGGMRGQRIQVNWYRPPLQVQPGETWRLRVRLRRPAGQRNPGGFDYAHWLYLRGIHLTASVRRDAGNRRLMAANADWVLAARSALATAMQSAVPRQEINGLLRALVIGDRSGFSGTDKRAFAATGTSHLIAISGLHVGLVALLTGWLAAAVWRRLPGLSARVPALVTGALAGCLAAACYAMLAGFSVPTQRALLMTLAGAGLLATGRTVPSGWVWTGVLAAVATWNPPGLLDPGLWLSFLAVAGIVWLAAARHEASRAIRWIRLQGGLAVLLWPLSLLFFGQVSMIGPLVNLVLIPWFSLVLVPLALIGTLAWSVLPAVGEHLWQAWAWLAEPTLALLRWASDLPVSTFSGSSPSVIVLVLAGVGGILLVTPRLPARWVAAVLILPLLWPAPARPPPGGYRVLLMDVGQGLAVLIQTAGHQLVFDAGPRFGDGFDAGERVVVPVATRFGAQPLDMLLVSHGDNDHAGGAGALLRAWPNARTLAGEPGRLRGALACQAGQSWEWDGVVFTVLSPDSLGGKGNNASCVLRVDNGHFATLLTGDIEASRERGLLEGRGVGESHLVIAPHHGSKSSSTPAFIAATAAEHVWFAAGRHNRWGFPKSEVVARWVAAGAAPRSTADDGALLADIPPAAGPVTIRSFARQRYWMP